MERKDVKMKMKKTGTLIAAVMSIFMLAGCGNTGSPASGNTDSGSGGSAGSDKPVILAVSFGTSYNDSREKPSERLKKPLPLQIRIMRLDVHLPLRPSLTSSKKGIISRRTMLTKHLTDLSLTV